MRTALKKSAWTDKYLGTPYARGGVRFGGDWRSGVDCWSLVEIVMQAERGVDLSNLLASDMVDGFVKVDTPREFDIVIFGREPFIAHCGIIVKPTSKMLHASNAGVVITDVKSVKGEIEYFRGARDDG